MRTYQITGGAHRVTDVEDSFLAGNFQNFADHGRKVESPHLVPTEIKKKQVISIPGNDVYIPKHPESNWACNFTLILSVVGQKVCRF